MHEIATATIVTAAAPARPMTLPPRPASREASNGSSGIASSVVEVIDIASYIPGSRLALQAIEFLDVDAAPLPEQHHEDRQSNCRLGRGHRQHEEYEDLAIELAEV